MNNNSTVKLTKEGHIAHVELSRPKQGNAMNSAFWKEFRELFQALGKDRDVRCVVISAQGKHFTVGLDIKDSSMLAAPKDVDDAARITHYNRNLILELQESFTAMERIPQPVIVCIHGAAIGGGIDLATAADIRYSTKDAFFSIKEVDIGLAADVGTLQRIQHVVGSSSLVRELAYSARRMEASEALQHGFVSRVFDSREDMIKEAMALAKMIASKSPLAIAGTKHNLNYSRGRPVQDGLEYMALWNAAMLQTDDISKAAIASLQKKDQPDFSKL